MVELNVWIEFQSVFAFFYFDCLVFGSSYLLSVSHFIWSACLMKWPRINYQITSANKFHLNKRQSISKVNKTNQIQNEWNSFFPECENDVRFLTKIPKTRLKFTKSLINREFKRWKNVSHWIQPSSTFYQLWLHSKNSKCNEIFPKPLHFNRIQRLFNNPHDHTPINCFYMFKRMLGMFKLPFLMIQWFLVLNPWWFLVIKPQNYTKWNLLNGKQSIQ